MMPSPKDTAEQAAKIINDMIRRGEAEVIVTLVVYANDPDFSTNPPSCRVTVTVTDPNNGNKIVDTATADIPTTTPPFEHTFRIPVETVVKRFKRWGKGKPPPLDVSIVAEPINGFEEMYEPDKTINGMRIKPARKEPRNIALKRKKKEDREDKENGFPEKRLP